jgi:uncharacterized protein
VAVKLTTRRIRANLRNDRHVTIPAWVLDSGRPGPALLLTAAQHGNEVQGSEVIRRFVDLARTRLRCGKVFAIPMVNLPAIRERRPHIRMKPEQPYSDDRGHNMNRWWPGKRAGNDTARIPLAIYSAFGDDATHAVDLHCWEKHAAPAVLVRDVPGIRDLAGGLGQRFVDMCPPSDRTLGGYFCASGRVGVTYEFAGQYVVDEVQVRRGLLLLTNMARILKLLPGRPARGDAPVLFSDQCDRTVVEAPRSGLFVGVGLKLCQPIDKGALLGHILSDVDLQRHEIRSPTAGYLRGYGASRAHCDVAIPGHHPYVTKGEKLAIIAYEK